MTLLALALPGTALAQGAGDDQYQDPFGDQPVQNDSQGSGDGGDGGLSDTPPGGGSGDSGSGSGSSGSGSSGSGSGATPPSTGETGTAEPGTAPEVDEQVPGQLPNTGADARVMLLLGLALVLMGVGLRLKTIDPDAF